MSNPNAPTASPKPQYLPTEEPERHFSDDELVWTAEEQARIDGWVSRYPTPDGAVMWVLWLAQQKYGWLPAEVIAFVARSLDLPVSKVYGVATFYTQYYKKPLGKYVLDVCTCFSCQVCGGYDILHYLEEKLGIQKGGTTDDGLFSIQEVECLGACGSAPMMQITNGPYVHNLTPEKCDDLVADLREGRVPGLISVTLPQDESELSRNRRSDAQGVDAYQTPPVSQTTE
jgi:NADH-quinone oxidoreductase subunit E